MSWTTTRQNELLDGLEADEAATARAFGQRQRALTELAQLAEHCGGSTGVEQFAGMELAGSCRKGRIAAEHDLAQACRYTEALPQTLRLLERGELFVHQAKALLEATALCTPEVAQLVEDRLLPAGTELAPPDLRRKARRAVLAAESELDSDAVRSRVERARAGRRVWVRPEEDGMAAIGLLGPAEQVRRWWLDLDQLVASEKAADHAAGVWRSADQIRADLVLAMPGLLLAAGQPGRTMPAVDTLVTILVPAATVLATSVAPGELAGYGPISAEHVRMLLPDARLRRALVDTDTGQPIMLEATATTSGQPLPALLGPLVVTDPAEPHHDPSPRLRRFIDLRDLHCRGVGCTLPARRCHKDHRIPYPAGPTTAGNLEALSASCHRAKHNGWRIAIGPEGGTTWTSPLGRTYRRPAPHEPPPAAPVGPRRAKLSAAPTRAAPPGWARGEPDAPLDLPSPILAAPRYAEQSQETPF